MAGINLKTNKESKMTNFEKYKNTIKPEDAARAMKCSECPLYGNKCDGFSHLGLLDKCVKLLVAWFGEEE